MLWNKVLGMLLMGVMVAGLAGAGGCSTVEGLGKDVQKGGEAIERAADRRQSN